MPAPINCYFLGSVVTDSETGRLVQDIIDHGKDLTLATVRPDIVVCLGAIAAKAVFGPKFRLMEQRGVPQRLPDGPLAFATVHPSWVLRQRDAERREEAWRNFLDDLRLLKRRRQ